MLIEWDENSGWGSTQNDRIVILHAEGARRARAMDGASASLS